MTITANAATHGLAAVAHPGSEVRRGPAVELALVTAGALVVAVTLPADVVVFGVLLVGVAHIVLELRYVVGRHPDVVGGTDAALLQAALVAVVLARLAAGAGVSRGIELAVWAGVLLWALARRFAGRPGPIAAGVTLVGCATALAANAGPAWFLILAHAHNFVPAVFLWQWAGRALDRPSRRRLRALVVGWAAVIPVLLLAGAADAVAGTGSPLVERLFGVDAATATVAPSGWVAGAAGHRLLVAFAFAQIVHYAVWIWYLPRHDPLTSAAFAGTRPGRALRGWRLPGVVAAGTLAVIALAAVDYRQGRALYSSLGAYHAYLEYPILVGLLIDSLTRRSPRAPRAVPAR
jgi:hypothetical protein